MNVPTYIALFATLVMLIVLNNRYEEKKQREEDRHNYETIHKYLLDEESLAKSKKPILWIEKPVESSSYLHLTVNSIIRKCDESFTICIIDDHSFKKLIPNWSTNLSSVGDPVRSNLRLLGQLKLVEMYGGLLCPASFICQRDLAPLYKQDTMFVCETRDNYALFMGAAKGSPMIKQLIELVQRNTTLSKFEFDKTINSFILKNKRIKLIDGIYVGTKTLDDDDILLDDLLSTEYLKTYHDSYGIWVPAGELAKRRKYGWFLRLNKRKVLESNTMIGKHLLATRENRRIKSEWVSFP